MDPLGKEVNAPAYTGLRVKDKHLYQEVNKPATTGQRVYNSRFPKPQLEPHKQKAVLEAQYKQAISSRQDKIFKFDNLEQNYGQVSRTQPQYKPKPEHGSFVRFQNDVMTDSWGKLLDPRAYSRQIDTDSKYHETERPVYGM